MTPADLPTIDLVLSDGTLASLRPIVPGDRNLVEEGLEHLSMEARIARFGMAIDHLSNAELEYLTNVDQVDHVAWGATIDGEPAGAARYIVVPSAECAELAIVVVDKFRGKGLGRTLLEALASSAIHNGIEHFCFAVSPDNQPVLAITGGLGATLSEESGLVQGSLAVSDVEPGQYAVQYQTLLAAAQDSSDS